MKLSKEEVRQLTRLSAINLTEKEQERFTEDLSSVFEYAKNVLGFECEEDFFSQNKDRGITDLRDDKVLNKGGYEFTGKLMESEKSRNGHFVYPRILDNSNS
jgi:aspartyl/glutamyl-tRNA(Asn/Gln) amidotransferase C subunit